MRIYKIALIISLLLLINHLYAQNPSVLPESYGNIPVNFNTGAPSLSVPIWTASSGSLSFPVYLSYSSNGVRVSDTPGVAGLGWNLSAGGSISQLVRGLPGENPDIPLNQFISTEYLDSVRNGQIDAEPDIFSYSFPGGGGQFFYDENGNIRTTVENYLVIKKLQVQVDTIIKDIYQITDAGGTVYTFGETQRTIMYHGIDNLTESTTWLLTKISTHDQIDEITLEYSRSNYLSYGDGYVTENNLFSLSEHSFFYTEAFQEMVFIKSITTQNEKIEFGINEIDQPDYQPERPFKFPVNDLNELLDLTVFGRSLDSIKIVDKNDKLVKKYEYDYDYFGRRYLLKSIKQFGDAGGELPGYQFSYNNIESIPDDYAAAYDFWGFYNNNASETTLVEYASRYPAVEKTGIGMLKRVDYPTGAFTQYEYEPNTYFFPDTIIDSWFDSNWHSIVTTLINTGEINESKNSLTGPGVRVKKILRNDGLTKDTLITEFSYDDENGSSGRLSNYPIFKYGALVIDNRESPPVVDEDYLVECSNTFGIEPGYVTYKRVSVYNGGMINDNKGKNGKIEYNYQVKAPVTIDEIELFKPQGQMFPYEVKLLEKEYNGVLLEKRIYDKDNKLKTSSYTEYDTLASVSKYVKGLKAALWKIEINPPYELDYHYTSRYYKVKQKRIQLKKTISRTYIEGSTSNFIETSKEYSYVRDNDTLLMPIEVTTTESNGDVLLSKFYYPADFGTDPACIQMLERNIITPVIEKKYYKNGEQLSGAKTKFGVFDTDNNDSLIAPTESQVWIDGVYETQSWFDKYDGKTGSLLQSHGRDSIKSITLYAYNGTLPVANVVNLEYSALITLMEGEVNINSLRDSYDPSYIESTLADLRSDIVTNPNYSNTYISYVIYQPLKGKTKVVDTNGRFMTYEYDEFGRLTTIKDQEGVIKKHNSYNLRK